MRHSVIALLVTAAFVASCRAAGQSSQAPLDRAAIERAAGTTATVTPDGVVRIGWSRADVPVTVDGVRFPPVAGLGSWAGFAPADSGAVVMGDMVVFQDEVDAAMDAAFAHGLEVTALHNHFLFADPPVFFMHIAGHGNAERLAAGVKAAWDAIKRVRAGRAVPAAGFGGPAPVAGGRLDTAAIRSITGLEPAVLAGGVVKVSRGRSGAMYGATVGGSMGLSGWASFVGSDSLASADGDLIMTAAEVQPVLQALRRAGIHIVALHNHMIGETPTFYFLHFWGTGPAASLARGFRAALAAQEN